MTNNNRLPAEPKPAPAGPPTAPLRCFVSFMPVPATVDPSGWIPVEAKPEMIELSNPDWKCREMVDLRRERAAIARDLLAAAEQIDDEVRRTVVLNIAKLITQRHTMESGSGPGPTELA